MRMKMRKWMSTTIDRILILTISREIWNTWGIDKEGYMTYIITRMTI